MDNLIIENRRIVARTQGRRHGPITRVVSPSDLGERIKQLPLTWVIGACLVGAWLGTRGARARVAGQRSR